MRYKIIVQRNNLMCLHYNEPAYDNLTQCSYCIRLRVLKWYIFVGVSMSLLVLKRNYCQCSSTDFLNLVLLWIDCSEWGNMFHNRDEW